MRIGCLQYDPKFKDVKGNTAKVREMTSRIPPNSLDLLVLPEMCLTGYMFPSSSSIQPYLEPPRIGPTSLLLRELATRLGCVVIGGYPEQIEGQDVNGAGDGNERNGYNSALVVQKTGEVVGNYRKTFLFETDKTWAREGQGFGVFELGQPLGRAVVGICMDMNPKDFVAPWDAYELSKFVREQKADMLIVPMNWLDPPREPGDEVGDTDGPEESTLNYWAHRMTPLHDPSPSFEVAEVNQVESETEVVFVACNRVGVEEGTTFVGTSSIMTLSSNPSRIELIECAGKKSEEVLVALVS